MLSIFSPHSFRLSKVKIISQVIVVQLKKKIGYWKSIWIVDKGKVFEQNETQTLVKLKLIVFLVEIFQWEIITIEFSRL